MPSRDWPRCSPSSSRAGTPPAAYRSNLTGAKLAMQLDGLRAAVLVTDGYEPSELTEPVRALREAGAEPTIVSDHDGQIKGKTDADTATVGVTLDTARPEDFAALVLPGGEIGRAHV